LSLNQQNKQASNFDDNVKELNYIYIYTTEIWETFNVVYKLFSSLLLLLLLLLLGWWVELRK
jgi:hypothetical protein